MTRLTPFDDELCVMVRSLTGIDAQVTEHETFYTIVVNMPNKSEAERKAIDDAINGRIGLRLTRANYNNFHNGAAEYDVMYYSEYENYRRNIAATYTTPDIWKLAKCIVENSKKFLQFR